MSKLDIKLSEAIKLGKMQEFAVNSNELLQSTSLLQRTMKLLAKIEKVIANKIKEREEKTLLEQYDESEMTDSSTNASSTTQLVKPTAVKEGTKIKNATSKCPICGTELEDIGKNGFCSAKCEETYIANKDKYSPTGKKSLFTKEKLLSLAEELKFYIGLLTEISDLIKEINEKASLSREIANCKVMLNYYALKLKAIISKKLAEKNKVMINAIKGTLYGITSIDFTSLGVSMSEHEDETSRIAKMFQAEFDTIYKTITDINKAFLIPADSMGIMTTIRAKAKGEKGNFIDFRDGSGWDGKLSISRPNLKILDKIESKIKDFAFPPLQSFEYLLDPTVFQTRLILSDQNYKSIAKVKEALLDAFRLEPEFLPKFSKLKPTNIWFMLALVKFVTPIVQYAYAMPFVPPLKEPKQLKP